MFVGVHSCVLLIMCGLVVQMAYEASEDGTTGQFAAGRQFLAQGSFAGKTLLCACCRFIPYNCLLSGWLRETLLDEVHSDRCVPRGLMMMCV